MKNPSATELRAPRLDDEQPVRHHRRRSTRKWCRGKVGVEHQPTIRLNRYVESLQRYQPGARSVPQWRPVCGWLDWSWRYFCRHERYCTRCGKILAPSKTPNAPITNPERTDLAAALDDRDRTVTDPDVRTRLRLLHRYRLHRRHPMNWFTADWHLGHRNILHLGNGRPFATIEEHNTQLVRRHNALVAPSDQVWVLGDAAMGTITDTLALCAQMNGHKILVCGNHDRTTTAKNLDKRAMWTNRYMTEGGFAGVLSHIRATTVKLSTDQLVLASHYPYTGDSQDEDRYTQRRPIDTGSWLLHGHVHHAWRINGRQINVGVDAWDYEPVPERRVIELIVTR